MIQAMAAGRERMDSDMVQRFDSHWTIGRLPLLFMTDGKRTVSPLLHLLANYIPHCNLA